MKESYYKMNNSERKLRGIVKNILEADFRLKSQLSKTTLRLTLHPDGHVPDTLTRIRVECGVSVVGQGDKVIRRGKGASTLVVYIKFLPDPELTEYEGVERLAKQVKKLPGVEIVRVVSLNNRPVLHNNRPIVF